MPVLLSVWVFFFLFFLGGQYTKAKIPALHEETYKLKIGVLSP